MKNVLVLQSGGPTAVINSSLYGVITEATKHKDVFGTIFGSYYGIDGVIDDNLVDLSSFNDDNLLYTPGAIIGSTRHKLSDDLSDPIYSRILETLKKHNIGYFYLIGGNDSMDSANKIHEYLSSISYDCVVLGIPKTIDNDLVGIDHTPGYGSAIKYIANSLRLIKQDTLCYKKGRVTIVEVMGRDAGWLAAGAKLSGVSDMILVPEVPFNKDLFLEKVEEIYKKNSSVLVVVSEGIKDKEGNYISASLYQNEHDKFSHTQLGGAAIALVDMVSSDLHLSVRAIELNLPQRCFSPLSSLTDINEAISCGKETVIRSLSNISGKMITIKRNKKGEITFDVIPLSLVANTVRYLDDKYIEGNFDISNTFIDYAMPLIQGEINPKYENGLIVLSKITK